MAGKKSGKVFQQRQSDMLLPVDEQTITTDGATIRFDMANASDIVSGFKALGKRVGVLAFVLHIRQTKTIPTNPARVRTCLCSMTQRLANDRLWIDVPEATRAFWSNTQPDSKCAHINFVAQNLLNPQLFRKAAMAHPLTRGGWPQSLASDGTFARLVPEPGAFPSSDSLLGFWGSDERMQVCAHVQGVDVTEPAVGDAPADYVVVPMARASAQGTHEAIPLSVMVQSNRSWKLQFTRRDPAALYEAATAFGDMVVSLFVLVREYRANIGGSDAVEWAMPWFYEYDSLGTTPKDIDKEKQFSAIGMMPLFGDVAADGGSAVVDGMGGGGDLAVMYEPRDFSAQLAAANELRWQEQALDSSDYMTVFPPVDSERHPRYVLDAWNAGCFGAFSGRARGRYHSEVVQPLVEAGLWAATRFSDRVANSLSYTTLGRAALGNYIDHVGMHSAIPFFPMAFVLPQVRGLPGGPYHTGAMNCPPRIAFALGTLPDTTNQRILILQDRGDLRGTYAKKMACDPCGDGGVPLLKPEFDNAGSSKSDVVESFMGQTEITKASNGK